MQVTTVVLYLACFLQLAGLFIFARGFFPHEKATLAGYAIKSELDVEPLFDKLIFIVIDALRSDFVFDRVSPMAAVHNLINSGIAIPFTAKAATPTVTLPRLKCLTSGSIPSFLDALLNFDETDASVPLIMQDSWLYQMQFSGYKSHMYGDDTWLRLFPSTFAKKDGTSSFVVSDFTEVDHNVTRHLDQEIEDNTWKTLILHYLGVDHIGHIGGPGSLLMPPKLQEMDEIVSRLYRERIQTSSQAEARTLQIVVGDHGMNNEGNHGGGADSESQTALLLISDIFKGVPEHAFPTTAHKPFLYYDSIDQTDIVPTISLLFGLPIPLNSIGVVPGRILQYWPPVQRLRAVAQNFLQLQRLAIASGVQVIDFQSTTLCGHIEACRYQDIDLEAILHAKADIPDQATIEELLILMHKLQDRLLSASNSFRSDKMYVGIALAGLAFLSAITSSYSRSSRWSDSIVLIIPLLHVFTAFASSFVEEEQTFWYYIASAVLLMNSILSRNFSSTIMAVSAFRVARRFVQTGQKYAGSPDISSLFKHSDVYESTIYPLFLPIIGIYLITRERHRDWFRLISLSGTYICISLFKTSYFQDPQVNMQLAKACWTSLLVTSMMEFYRRRADSRLPTSIVLFIAILQTRREVIMLLCLFIIIGYGIKHTDHYKVAITTFVVLQQASFYALGNSNALSGLDLSQLYNGLSSFDPKFMLVLLFITTIIGPMYWQAILLEYCRGQADRKNYARRLMAVCSTSYAFAFCVSCETMKHHLFVFSVFSPKLLYTAGWATFYTLAIISL